MRCVRIVLYVAKQLIVVPSTVKDRAMIRPFFKKLLPFEHLRVHSPLAPQDVRERLQAEFDRSDSQDIVAAVFADYCIRRYDGELQRDTFWMQTKPLMRLLYIPAVVVRGTLQQEESGTVLNVKAHLNARRLLPGLFLALPFVAMLMLSDSWAAVVVFLLFTLAPVIVVAYIAGLVVLRVSVYDIDRFFYRVLSR